MERPEARDLLGQTMALWQSRCQRALVEEDARQIIENAVGFFSVLAEWDSESGSEGPPPEKGGGE